MALSLWWKGLTPMYVWTTAIPAVSASFAASLVEVVEAFTIVLAASTLRGWRPALYGAVAGLCLLFVATLALGPLVSRIPLHLLQLIIGTLLLLFGLRWLRKAILRSAGIIPLHDEEATFAEERGELIAAAGLQKVSLEWLAGATAFKAVILEGLEVVFIIIAVGSGRGLLLPASLGAVVALILVLLVGAVAHRPLSRVPENTLKFGVGVMLSAFGVFWTGEGLGMNWPGNDLAIIAFAVTFLISGMTLGRALRRQPPETIT